MPKRSLFFILLALLFIVPLAAHADDTVCTEHSFGAWVSDGNGQHTRTCTQGCTETADCTGGTATCVSAAVCSVCGGSYGEADLENHAWDAGVVTTEPTCTNQGVRTYTCTHNASHTKAESIDVNPEAHAWDEGTVVTAATCTAEGVKRFVCLHDASHTKEESFPVDESAHQWGEAVETKASTCRTPGTLTYTCLLNEAHTRTEELPINPEAHFFRDGKVVREATCTTEGILSYTCLYSASHVIEETIPVNPDAHKWDGGMILREASCASTGEILYTCLENADHTRTEELPIDLSLHQWGDRVVTLDATCTRDGKITLICSIDSSHTGTETIPAIGHNWTISTVTKEPECTEPGVMTYTCANDASHTKTESIPATGHYWGNMTVLAEPTCVSEGRKSYICGYDIDHTTIVRIAPDPNAHQYELTDETIVLPGICQPGEAKIARCVHCGDETHIVTSEPQSHTYLQWSPEANNYHTAVCATCGQDEISVLCHDAQDAPCPICRDASLQFSSVYNLDAIDSDGDEGYALSTSAGGGMMHLTLHETASSALHPAEIDRRITVTLDETQLAEAFSSATDALSQRALAILADDSCRILRRDDFVLIRSSNDALIVHFMLYSEDGDENEKFCHIDDNHISFTIGVRQWKGHQCTIWLVLEEP